MKLLKLAAAVICAAFILAACGEAIPEPDLVSKQPEPDLPPERPAYPVSFDDQTFDAAPVSVASLSPALTEIIFDLGAQDILVGVSDYCDYPAEAEALPKLGSPANPDISAITAAAPELLLTQSPIAAPDALALKNAGIRILELGQPKSFAELCEVYIKLSMAFYGAVDSQATASAALSGIDSEMSAAQDLGINVSYVIVEREAEGGLMLSPGGTLCSDMLSVYGNNLWEREEKYFADEDELFELAPDVVFYSDELDKDGIGEEFPHSELIPISIERFERPTVRLKDVIAGCSERLSRLRH